MKPTDNPSPNGDALLEQVEGLIARMRAARPAEREGVKQELITLASGATGGRVRDIVETLMKQELLEIQWELEEVIEATAPKKVEPPKPQEPEPKKEDPNRPLTAADLNLVYDDPRGLMLHKTKKGERWFATQVDPRTGQPQTFELHPQEIQQLKTQLQGSPYWLLGAG